jgi:hypothetical protein
MSQKFDEIIRKRKQFNGKPFSHWQDQADELVVESILRAALPHTEAEHPSIIGYLAGKRLMCYPVRNTTCSTSGKSSAVSSGQLSTATRKQRQR